MPESDLKRDKSLFNIEESQKEVERRAAVSHFSPTPNVSETGTLLFWRQDPGQRENAPLYKTHTGIPHSQINC